MTNEEVMNLMAGMGLHEGGIENWVMDNAWFRLANHVAEHEREECALIAWNYEPDEGGRIETAIRARGTT